MIRSLILAALAASALALPAAAQDGRGLDAFFARADADGDGRITEAELAALRGTQFARADRNADGALSATEQAAVRARAARFTAAMEDAAARMDRDGDGSIAQAEFMPTPGWFRLIDVDGDGAVSRAEADRARAAWAN